MAELAQREISNLPTPIGSGGTLVSDVFRPAPSINQPATIDLALAGAVMMPFLVFGVGTGSAALEDIYAPPMATGAWIPVAYYGSGATPVEQQPIWQRQLAGIKSDFQITVTDLARFLLVERPSVYQWFADTEPRQRNLARIRDLAELASTWTNLGLGPIRAYLASRRDNFPNSLEEMLTMQPLPVNIIRQTFADIANAAPRPQVVVRPSLSDRLVERGFLPTDEAAQTRNRALAIPSTSPGEE